MTNRTGYLASFSVAPRQILRHILKLCCRCELLSSSFSLSLLVEQVGPRLVDLVTLYAGLPAQTNFKELSPLEAASCAATLEFL